jgi:hypothetical protein
MMTPLRRLIGTVAASVMLVVGAGLPAQAQEQDGLVNIAIGDVTILEDVRLAVAANVVANVCNLDVTVAVLALVDEGGQDFTCDFRSGPQDVTVTQND